jgi:hypothetical protein
LKVSFSKIKSQKEVTKQKESRFFLLFLLGDRRIRIRIQEAHKHVDPVDPDPDSDPDPQHCFLEIRSTKEDFLFISAILCAVTQNFIIWFTS